MPKDSEDAIYQDGEKLKEKEVWGRKEDLMISALVIWLSCSMIRLSPTGLHRMQVVFQYIKEFQPIWLELSSYVLSSY